MASRKNEAAGNDWAESLPAFIFWKRFSPCGFEVGSVPVSRPSSYLGVRLLLERRRISVRPSCPKRKQVLRISFRSCPKSQSESFFDDCSRGSEAGNTLCCGGGIAILPMRSCQRNLLRMAVSTASAWLKSSFLPSTHSLVFT